MKIKNLILFAVALCAAAFLAASPASAASFTLTWDDNSVSETGFKVERAIGIAPLDTAYELIATTGANVTTYIDTTAAAGVEYSYRVRAYDATRVSPYSNAAVTPLPAPSGASVTPTPLVAKVLEPGQAITVKNSYNPTRPNSKTVNVPPRHQLLVLSN